MELPDRVIEGRRDELVMKSPGMQRLGDLLNRMRNVDSPVLIEGETGTGKELVARIIHRESRRATGPFIVINCASLTPELLEVELFGAVEGAFTDLDRDREGLLSAAESGTVLLDEVADLHPHVQAKLIRVLAEGTIRRIGAETKTQVDVRFLFSTSKCLTDEVDADRFRVDLYHRIQVISVTVPPLRNRTEDLADLENAFILEHDRNLPQIDDPILQELRDHSWTGNVRELRNVVQRLAIESTRHLHLSSGNRTRVSKLVFSKSLLSRKPLPDLIFQLEKDYLVHHLRQCGGDTRALCDFLHVTRRHLYRRFQRLGVKVREVKKELEQDANAF